MNYSSIFRITVRKSQYNEILSHKDEIIKVMKNLKNIKWFPNFNINNFYSDYEFVQSIKSKEIFLLFTSNFPNFYFRVWFSFCNYQILSTFELLDKKEIFSVVYYLPLIKEKNELVFLKYMDKRLRLENDSTIEISEWFDEIY